MTRTSHENKCVIHSINYSMWCVGNADIPKSTQIMIIHCGMNSIVNSKPLDITTRVVEMASTWRQL